MQRSAILFASLEVCTVLCNVVTESTIKRVAAIHNDFYLEEVQYYYVTLLHPVISTPFVPISIWSTMSSVI